MDRLVVFTLDDQRYGLPLSAVERVVPMVDITPLPKAPDIVLGVVDVQGRVIPVVNLRRRLRLPERDIALTDQLVIARTALHCGHLQPARQSHLCPPLRLLASPPPRNSVNARSRQA